MQFSAFPDRWRPSSLRATGSVIAPGVASTLIVALAATYLSDHYHAPPVIFALLLGMALNQLSAEARYAPGINVSARTLLRISVALLGLRITFGQIGELGWSTAAMVIVTVPAEPSGSAERQRRWPLPLHGRARTRSATPWW